MALNPGDSVLKAANDSLLGNLSSTVAKAIHTVPAGPTPGGKLVPKGK
jgi:hypothetical protein